MLRKDLTLFLKNKAIQIIKVIQIRAYVVPSCFSGMILGTDGYMAEGTSEKPIPRMIIRIIAIGVVLRKGMEYIA